MENTKTKRKLTAILSADVKGYSRLMGEDEKATVATLKKYRDIISSLVDKHSGRVVDSPGDNVLAEFASVVDAVESAVEIQKELKAKNAELPENRRMEFRVGINLGDVIEEGERIYGDGVNIAARIESLAEGGGIYISGTAFDHVESKLGLKFDYLGEKAVKNIKKPVRVYRVKTEDGVSDVEVSRKLPLPDKPSIAVLSFVNMSGDTEQEYFSDGLTEEIITTLSKVPQLFVIARNSTFTYKGQSVNVKQVGQELGVEYVLEGSVRKGGDNVRITAQLIDATTGHHVWAERYDRRLKDIFAVQDDIAGKILMALDVKLINGEQARFYQTHSGNIEATLKMFEARSSLYRWNKEGSVLARKIFEEITAMEPEWGAPYGFLGLTHVLDVWYRWSDSPVLSIQKAFQLSQKAIALDESSPIAHGLLGFLYSMTRQHDQSIEEGEKAIQLEPNSADAHGLCAVALHFASEPAKAISLLQKAIRLNPFPPSWYLMFLGHAYRNLGNYEESASAFKNAIKKEPASLLAHTGLTATYSLLGLEEEARSEVAEVLKIDPGFSVKNLANTVPYKDKIHLETYIDALRKAGLK